MTTRKDIIPAGMENIFERFRYAPGVLVDDTLHIAGQVGRNANLEVIEGSEAQFTQAFENVGKVLAAAGAGFDDVVEIQNIDFEGEIIGAQLQVTFLDTATAGDNEDFFDYSNGFEEFAILTSPDATLLDSAAIGISDSPTAIAYDVSAPSGTPEPPLLLLLAVPGLLLWRYRRR